MIELNTYREVLTEIAGLLSRSRQYQFATIVQAALDNSDTMLKQFLTSNAMWGGAGSIADSGIVTDELAATMIRLGRLQIQAGKVNPRTEMWTEVFEKQIGGK